MGLVRHAVEASPVNSLRSSLVQVNGQFVKMCKRLVLQFVILRPILAIFTIVLSARGVYKQGTWSTDSGYAFVKTAASENFFMHNMHNILERN
jgi:hypothetical protein